MENQQTYRKLHKVLISGGGTGGHIFPALAIADEITNRNPGVEILFVGAEGRMEMEKVPKHGYKIEGLWISGFQRKNLLKNLTLPVKLISSTLKANSILKKFKPEVVVGVGGYASGPMLYFAGLKKIPTVIQEQNSYPGVTNKILAKKADKICVAYPEMQKFFPTQKIVYTGNPVRKFQQITENFRLKAIEEFGFSANKPVVMLTGGSLGSGAMNAAIFSILPELVQAEVQLLWQTGKYYFETYKEKAAGFNGKGIKILPFFDDMDKCYAASDIVISRAGAITLSELALLAKAAILIPSPNVAEDHQTKNAETLVQAQAAVLVKETEVNNILKTKIFQLIENKENRLQLEQNISKFAKPMATTHIVETIENLVTRIGK